MVPLHVMPSEHVLPLAMHRSVPGLQQSLFGETPAQAGAVAQQGLPVVPHNRQVPP